MPDKAKTLLFSVLLLPATAMATTGNGVWGAMEQ